ncbi:hypothetical protein [Streptomyces nitrosporeus]|uniref:hypothetical protein n=1 Tax=Streptomyces nitrosporeus TaxID=28894 RepID=UPI0039A20111
MTTPQISVSDIRALLDAQSERPVLYLTEDGQLDVWADAYVWHHRIVLTAAAATELLGEAPTREDIVEVLPEVQAAVDTVVETLATR